MIKDIVVYLDQDDTRQSTMDAAINLAKAHGAHVTGLFVAHDLRLPGHAAVPIPIAVYEAHRRELKIQSQAVGVGFRRALEHSQVQGTYLSVDGDPEYEVNELARYADLVVVGQQRGERLFAEGADWVGLTILHSSAPVMVVPSALPGQIGQRILVAWNESREATRAVNDAMPLLVQARQVVVTTVNAPAGDADTSAADLCVHLARHGVVAEANVLIKSSGQVAEHLLRCVSDRQIDLLIAGSYGHSRLREFVLGGVTRYVLNNATVPVLMAH